MSANTAIHMEALIIAAYLHDLSAAQPGLKGSPQKSAEMAVEFLRELDASEECVKKVKQAIVSYASASATEKRESTPIEALILYDADKLGRLSGLAVVTSLIEFGARYPNRSVTGEMLAAILRHVEERFIDLYQSLNTNPAREMARDKFNRTLAFLDGVIEHLGDATPV